MKIYDGGSNKDDLIFNSDQLSLTGNSVPSLVTSTGSQIFMIFNTNGKGVGKGFTAKISFGIESLNHNFFNRTFYNITSLQLRNNHLLLIY